MKNRALAISHLEKGKLLRVERSLQLSSPVHIPPSLSSAMHLPGSSFIYTNCEPGQVRAVHLCH